MSPYLIPFDPFQVVDIVHPLQVHGDSFAAIGDLDRYGLQLDAARLLKIGELGDLHPVQPDLPAQTPGAQRGGFPVILDEADIVLVGIDPERPAGSRGRGPEDVKGEGFMMTWNW